MSGTDQLVFDLSPDGVAATFNGVVLETAFATVSYRTLLRRTGDLPAECMLWIGKCDGELTVSLYPKLSRCEEAPLCIEGDDAIGLYRCLYAPGRDPLLPTMIIVQVRK